MPLSMVDEGREYVITAVKGNDAARRHLESLGFTMGAQVMVISRVNGGFIVNVKETRIAVNRQMANRVRVMESI